MDVDGTITPGTVTLLSQPDGTALEIKRSTPMTAKASPWPAPLEFAPE